MTRYCVEPNEIDFRGYGMHFQTNIRSGIHDTFVGRTAINSCYVSIPLDYEPQCADEYFNDLIDLTDDMPRILQKVSEETEKHIIDLTEAVTNQDVIHDVVKRKDYSGCSMECFYGYRR